MKIEEATQKAGVLIEALPYILRFRGKFVVVKYGGSVMRNKLYFRAVMEDIVFMSTVGLRVILVHGGGFRISDALAEKGIASRFVDGLRVTDEAAIRVIESVILEVNREMARTIREIGGRVAPVSPADGIFKATRVRHGEADLGQVGEITSLDSDAIRRICERGEIPLVMPLAYGEDNLLYNINADPLASRLASLLPAEKLVFLTDQPGIMRNSEDRESLISVISAEQAETLVEQGIIVSGMIPKVRAGLEAMQRGVTNVHMIGGNIRHALLLEIFTTQGVGTEIVSS